MSDTKKYYYMRLVDGFYDRPEIKLIEKIENGYQYVTILLKMYLRSLKHDGALTFSDGIPYDIQMLSSVIGHDMVMIEKAIEIFQKYKLVEIMDDGTIYMTKIQNFIGESSTEADRKRRFRARIDSHAGQLSDNRPPELEIEFKDRDRDRDRDRLSDAGVPSSSPSYKGIKKERKQRTPTPIEALYFDLYKNVFGVECKLSGKEYAMLNQYAKNDPAALDKLRIYFGYKWPAEDKYRYCVSAFMSVNCQRQVDLDISKAKFFAEKDALLIKLKALKTKKDAAPSEAEWKPIEEEYQQVRKRLLKMGEKV